LEEAQEAELDPDTLVLGCTHYPLLRPMMEAALSPAIRVIDSAQATANQAARMLGEHVLPGGVRTSCECRFFATDSVAKFQNLGARFLGSAIDQVELVDLGG
jgi:glutamate racemase